MVVVLCLIPLSVVIAIVWPIVAIVKEQKEQVDYTFTACVAAWYTQLMAMVGIVVFTIGIGYLFKSLISYLNLGFSYGPTFFPILGQGGPASLASFEQQRLTDLVVRTPSFIVGGPVIYFMHAYLSRTVSAQRVLAPYWVLRGSQFVQTAFLGTVSTLASLVALNLVLGYLLIAPLGNQPKVPFGEMLGFALAFTSAFAAHVMIWQSYPGGSWWSPPDIWPPARQLQPDRSIHRAIWKIVALSAVLAVVNGILQEVLWRGAYITLFPGQFWLAVLYPTTGFVLWHFAPQSIFPYKGSGGRVALVAQV